MTPRNQRLGRNPFDRGSYSAGAKAPAKKSKAKPKPKGASRARARKKLQAPWRILLGELLRMAPLELKRLKICERVKRAKSTLRQLKAAVST